MLAAIGLITMVAAQSWIRAVTLVLATVILERGFSCAEGIVNTLTKTCTGIFPKKVIESKPIVSSICGAIGGAVGGAIGGAVHTYMRVYYPSFDVVGVALGIVLSRLFDKGFTLAVMSKVTSKDTSKDTSEDTSKENMELQAGTVGGGLGAYFCTVTGGIIGSSGTLFCSMIGGIIGGLLGGIIGAMGISWFLGKLTSLVMSVIMGVITALFGIIGPIGMFILAARAMSPFLKKLWKRWKMRGLSENMTP